MSCGYTPMARGSSSSRPSARLGTCSTRHTDTRIPARTGRGRVWEAGHKNPEGPALPIQAGGLDPAGHARPPLCGIVLELGGDTFLMGGEDPDGFPDDREGPVREVRVEPFAISARAVTTEEFAAFVAATGHVTRAERFGWSFVFARLLPDDSPRRALSPRLRGGARSRGPTGAGQRVPGRRWRAVRRIPRCTSRGPTRVPTAPGPAGACQPRPNGSTPRGVGSCKSAFPGGTS